MNKILHSPSATVIYISHGGGPLPLLGDGSHEELVTHLHYLSTIIEKPSAIVIISAHWEEKTTTITAGNNPPLIYDYYGFPKESYEIHYPAPGDSKLAKNIYDLLHMQGIEATLDEHRGFAIDQRFVTVVRPPEVHNVLDAETGLVIERKNLGRRR